MSESRGAASVTRCIWPSRELLAELERSISFDGDAKAIARQLLAMHDAAPADPAEAIAMALHQLGPRLVPWLDELPAHQEQYRREANHVLRALGMPY